MKARFAFLGLLATVAALVACQREPKAVENPNFDPSSNKVKTNLVLNISTGTGSDQTKTTPNYAQAGTNPTFLGMEAVHILNYDIPYATPDGESFFFNPWYKDSEGQWKKLGAMNDFNLGNLFGPKDVSTEKASRTVELALDLGTNNLLLYGKALKSSGSSDAQGAVNLSGNPADITTLAFSLVPRLSSQLAFDAGDFIFSRMLNSIMCEGLVDEKTFWKHPTGNSDKRYKFWWPQDGNQPSSIVDDDGKEYADGKEIGIYKFHKGQLSWKQLGQMYVWAHDGDPSTDASEIPDPDMAYVPLGEILGEAYHELTTIQEDLPFKELRAGSASAILRTMQDLYAIVERISSSTVQPTGWEEQVVKLLAGEIKSRMDLFFTKVGGSLYYLPTYATDDDGKSTGVPDGVDFEQFIKNVQIVGDIEDWDAHDNEVSAFNVKYLTYGDNKGFPINVGLPFGGACLACDVKQDIMEDQKSVDMFSYVHNIPAYGMSSEDPSKDITFPITNYRYPPELMYYGNATIRVSDNDKATYPKDITGWEASTWPGWEKASVSSTTRCVAMIEHINYGTALLKTSVKYDPNISAFKDNNSAIHPGEDDNLIPITTSGAKASNRGLVITGMVIGGQPSTVCWDYTRASDDNNTRWVWDKDKKIYTGPSGEALKFDNNDFDKMIYDKVDDYLIGSADPIYTFAWDNYDSSLAADKQSDVFIGLEILNETGKDFWGELNLVRNGGTFYLIGKLELSKAHITGNTEKTASDLVLNRDFYRYPPFDTETGETIEAPRVFMQDYATIANVMLMEDALKHAYVTMPDLRSSQITLGLSIDMTWQPGLEYTVYIGTEPQPSNP